MKYLVKKILISNHCGLFNKEFFFNNKICKHIKIGYLLIINKKINNYIAKIYK